MRRSLVVIRSTVFGLGVLGALAFGVSQAAARPAKACASPSIGTCGTRGQCLRMCGEYPGAPAGQELIDGQCSGGCCYCEWGFLQG